MHQKVHNESKRKLMNKIDIVAFGKCTIITACKILHVGPILFETQTICYQNYHRLRRYTQKIRRKSLF